VGGKHWLQDVFGFYFVDNQPLVLCGWIAGPSARHMEQLSDEQVVQGCLELLQKFAGRGFNVMVPRPEVTVRYVICAAVGCMMMMMMMMMIIIIIINFIIYLFIYFIIFTLHKAEACFVCG
jgi:hypothetical protein